MGGEIGRAGLGEGIGEAMCLQRLQRVAMAAGMAPAALSLGGSDPSFRQPMAIVVIGGLLTSTVFTLVIIPILFVFMEKHSLFRQKSA